MEIEGKTLGDIMRPLFEKHPESAETFTLLFLMLAQSHDRAIKAEEKLEKMKHIST